MSQRESQKGAPAGKPEVKLAETCPACQPRPQAGLHGASWSAKRTSPPACVSWHAAGPWV